MHSFVSQLCSAHLTSHETAVFEKLQGLEINVIRDLLKMSLFLSNVSLRYFSLSFIGCLTTASERTGRTHTLKYTQHLIQ